jgi:hypothetical protein
MEDKFENAANQIVDIIKKYPQFKDRSETELNLIIQLYLLKLAKADNHITAVDVKSSTNKNGTPYLPFCQLRV